MNPQSPSIIEESRKEFFSRLMFLALPIMLQNLLVSSVSFIDTMMIGTVGEHAIAAVGLGNQMFFLITLFFFGISSGAAIFVAQYWGAQDRDSMHKVMGIALILSVGGALLSSIVSFAIPEVIMSIFTDDPTVVVLGKEYLEVVAFSYPFTAVVMIYSISLRSTGDAKTPLNIAVVAMSMNVLLNYVLILGKWGFPRLEVRGAALATVIARGVEMVLLLGIIYKKKHPVAAPLKHLFGFNRAMVKKYLITCTPVILNEVFWSVGMTAYKIAYSRMGMQVIASVNVSESIQNLFFVVLMGITNASAIMIGNRIGENNINLAKRYASRLSLIGFLVGAFLGALLAVLAPLLSRPFNLSPAVAHMTTLSLISLGVLVPIKAFNMVLVVGVLRAGGDTRFSMFAELSGVWLIGVPCAFLGALVLGMPIHHLYLFVGLEEAFKFVVGIIRIKSGKWLNRLTEDPPPLVESLA
jgi:putative MATE family efflux protein